eukprot:1156039-Pelagomonas_calceolata.AAC.13
MAILPGGLQIIGHLVHVRDGGGAWKRLKSCISPTTEPFHIILFAMMLFSCEDYKSLKFAQFGAVDGQEWRLGGQQVDLLPRLIRHMCQNIVGQALAMQATFCNQA